MDNKQFFLVKKHLLYQINLTVNQIFYLLVTFKCKKLGIHLILQLFFGTLY